MHRVLLLNIASGPDTGLGTQLAQCGFIVQTADDIAGAVRLLRNHSPTLAILDIGDGTAVDPYPSLQTLSSVPVAVMCTRRDAALSVRCLEAGADTVLVAPLSRRELATRIGSVLGCRNGSLFPQPPLAACPYRVGNLVVDPESHVATKAGRSIALTPTEFRLLVALARRAGETVCYADLLSEVWSVNRADGLEHLRLYVRYLRQKLEDDHSQPRLLLNQRGIGYRLEAGATSANGRESNGH